VRIAALRTLARSTKAAGLRRFVVTKWREIVPPNR
jgi:hypothetical protein